MTTSIARDIKWSGKKPCLFTLSELGMLYILTLETIEENDNEISRQLLQRLEQEITKHIDLDTFLTELDNLTGFVPSVEA